MYELYKRYWIVLATWAGSSEIKRQATVFAIPALLQLLLGGFFSLADSGWFSFMQRFKIQAKKRFPIENSRLNNAARVFVRNLFSILFVSPIVVFIT